MNDIRVRSVIESLYNQLLHPAHGLLKYWHADPALALMFSVHISQENYGYEKNGNTHHDEWRRRYNSTVHVIITARHRVYVAIGGFRWKTIPMTDWKNTSNHDSEWRGGLSPIDQEISNAWDHCYRWMEDDEVACAHMPENMYYPQPHVYMGQGLSSSEPIKFVRVTRAPLEPRDSYFDQITAIEEVDFFEVMRAALNRKEKEHE